MLEWLSETALARALITRPTLYIFANAAHIFSIGLLAGSIISLDLRILGLFREPRLSVLGPFLARSAMVGVVLSIVTGFIIFSVNAVEYAANPAFLTKLGLLVAGIANALALHASPGWRVALDSDKAPVPTRIGAALSILIWISAIVAGRWIGFI